MTGRPGWARRLRSAAALGCAALLAACASSVAPPPPIPGAYARLPEVPESVVGVHASAGYAAMSAAVSEGSPNRFANVAAVDLGPLITVDATATRSAIVLSRAGSAVGFSTGVHIDGTVGLPCGVCRAALHINGELTGTAEPRINPDWSLVLASKGHYQLQTAELRFPFVPASVSIKDAVGQVLQGPFDEQLAKMNAEAARSPALKTVAQSAWAGLGQPIQVSVSPPVWLTINPTRILTEQPTVTDQGIDLGVAMVARPVLVVGDMPAAQDPGPLPDLTLVDQIPQQFSVYLPVRLTWDDATELAQQDIAGRPLNAGGGITVTIDKISIFNNGDELGVKIAFRSKSVSGTIYLLGKPVYDLADGYIAIENLHMDISTQNLLVQFAAWLTHQSLVDDLEAKLHFDIKKQVEARRSDLDKAIDGVQINPKVSLSGHVSSLAPSAVYITRDGLQVNVVALGTLNVLLH
jgi:hypothetical protein